MTLRRPRSATLLAALLAELVLFSVTGTNFASVGNAAEVLRLSVELGLLALALTPVVVSGGIDLSVGSSMGLCAVVLGATWRDLGLPIWGAAALAVGVGGLAGAINGALVARLRLPALIVTLGTYSLYRGLAEGLTRGVDNYTRFPEGFLSLGQGYFWGALPCQGPVLALAALGFWFYLHRTIDGRALFAIGLAPEGARYAGLPVERRLFVAYVLSGLASGLAAVVFVAHAGQAKADAGTGHELMAITAVVLGGTSIFGGRGSVVGTLLGLFAIAVLQTGLRLSDLPAELAGALTGGLLLATIGLGQRAEGTNSKGPTHDDEGLTMKNSQVAMLCGAILLGALLVVGGNWLLVKSLAVPAGGPTPSPKRPIVVAMMPKSKGNAYFIACRKGAEEAAKELGVELIWDGPTEPGPAKQNEVVDAWITRGVDVIAVAVENREGISSVLRKARSRGIKVVTWDSDAETDARDFFVNQATPEGIGNALMDNAARVLGNQGEFAIITASLTAANMIAWQEAIEARRAEKYPNVKMAALRPCDDLQKKAFDEANVIMSAHPNVKLIMAICSPAVPGAAEAVKQSGRKDVKVLGLGLPNDNKSFVHEGITDCVILWNTMDLGRLTVFVAAQVAEGRLRPGATEIEAGGLGTIKVAGDNVLLGEPFAFTKDNIDQFDF